jgi:hypothetical protein
MNIIEPATAVRARSRNGLLRALVHARHILTAMCVAVSIQQLQADTPTRQVVIESKFVEIRNDVARELGVNFNLPASSFGHTPPPSPFNGLWIVPQAQANGIIKTLRDEGAVTKSLTPPTIVTPPNQHTTITGPGIQLNVVPTIKYDGSIGLDLAPLRQEIEVPTGKVLLIDLKLPPGTETNHDGLIFLTPRLGHSPSQPGTAGIPVERAPVPTDLFRAGEVQLRFGGIGGVGHDEHLVTDERTVKETKTVTETTFVKETVLKTIIVNQNPIDVPVQVDQPVTTEHKVTTKKTLKHTRNDAAIQGGFGGLGADANYFVTRHIGLGLEGDWLDGESSIGDIMGTVTARCPMGSNAPYLFAGAGVQFGDRTQAVGKLGGGVEHRFSPTAGVFADACWMFGDHENAAVFRLGCTFTFGPCCQTTGHPSSETSAAVSWSQINPVVKDLRH